MSRIPHGLHFGSKARWGTLSRQRPTLPLPETQVPLGWSVVRYGVLDVDSRLLSLS